MFKQPVELILPIYWEMYFLCFPGNTLINSWFTAYWVNKVHYMWTFDGQTKLIGKTCLYIHFCKTSKTQADKTFIPIHKNYDYRADYPLTVLYDLLNTWFVNYILRFASHKQYALFLSVLNSLFLFTWNSIALVMWSVRVRVMIKKNSKACQSKLKWHVCFSRRVFIS